MTDYTRNYEAAKAANKGRGERLARLHDFGHTTDAAPSALQADLRAELECVRQDRADLRLLHAECHDLRKQIRLEVEARNAMDEFLMAMGRASE